MPKGLFNWDEKDVIQFLKDHGFGFYEPRKGSHYAYKNLETQKVVEINIPKNSFTPRTLETMIRQSGLDKNHWRKWSKTGAHCCEKNRTI